jgi:endonuclease-3 related protein
MTRNNLEKLYSELKTKHGRPQGQWRLWCKRPKSDKEREEVILGAILTQRTNWNNVELAIANLKAAKADSLKIISKAQKRRFAPLIKSSGFYKTKADYLLNLAKYIVKNYGNVAKMKKQNAEKLREELLRLKGVGPETTDSILLYALDKPVFVIDEYTRRLVKKRKLTQNLSYDFLQKLFEKNTKKYFRLYQDFHALIVIDSKNKN